MVVVSGLLGPCAQYTIRVFSLGFLFFLRSFVVFKVTGIWLVFFNRQFLWVAQLLGCFRITFRQFFRGTQLSNVFASFRWFLCWCFRQFQGDNTPSYTGPVLSISRIVIYGVFGLVQSYSVEFSFLNLYGLQKVLLELFYYALFEWAL